MNNLFKHIMPLSLVSLLATCQPSYAIAPHYQPLNNHSLNYIDVVAVNGNNPCATPHCVVRIGVLQTIGARTAHNAVFLCALLPVRVMTGCMRVSKDTLVPMASTPTLYNLSPFGLASFGDGSKPQSIGANYHG